MSSLLQSDLIVRRGGNKHRLIARCWVAAHQLPTTGTRQDDPVAYQAFRKLHEKKSFQKIHEMFDPILPVQYRAWFLTLLSYLFSIMTNIYVRTFYGAENGWRNVGGRRSAKDAARFCALVNRIRNDRVNKVVNVPVVFALGEWC